MRPVVWRPLPFCQNCGKPQPDDATFCSSCGKPMAAVPSSPRPASSQSGSLSATGDLVMKKKILSLREHYDFEDRAGTKLGHAEGNFFQFPARFTVNETGGSEFMHVEGKLLSFRREFKFYDASDQELGTIKRRSSSS